MMKVFIDALPTKTKCCATCEKWYQIGCTIGYCPKLHREKCSTDGKYCKKYILKTKENDNDY